MTEVRRPGYEWLAEHVGHVGDACLLWPFSCCTAGYGMYAIDRKRYLAHREMCRATHGDPPSTKHQAAHACGNRRCVNPNHLSWKSRRDNQLDRRMHGTHATRRTKISIQQAEQIRQLKGKETSIETAAKYGITESNVRLIQDGKTWKPERKYRMHLPDDVVRAIRKIGRSQVMHKTAAAFGTTDRIVWKIINERAYTAVR